MHLNRLGFVDTIVEAATKAVPALLGPGGTKIPAKPRATQGQPVPGGAVPAAASGPVTVSPAMQQAFTPQFSPVMQMTQDSPGATQAASPTQMTAPMQAARSTGGGPATPYGTPYPGTYPGSDYGDWPRPPTFPEAFPDPYQRPVFQKTNGDMTKLLTTGIIAVAAIGAIQMVGRRDRKNKK